MNSDANPGSFSSIQDDRNGGAGGDLRDISQSPRSSIDVSIIVVSYNTREMTLECLRSIVAETTQVEYEVLFIDNCSTDGSFDAVHDEFGDDSRFHLVLADENLGFAGANNVLAESAKGKYLLLLNPDTVVLDRAIEELLDFAEANPKNGIWGGRTLFADGSLNPTSCWGPFTAWSEFCGSFGLRAMLPESLIFNPRSYGRWQRDSIREVGIVTGCFFLMRIEDWNALGGFDPEFFMYGEEADLCMRGIRRGMRPIVTPNATIIHHGGASEPIQVDKMVRLHDANVRLFRRHFSDLGFRFAFLTMRFGILLRSIVVSIRNGIRRRPIGNNWSCLWQRRNEWTRGAVGRKLGPS